jgi:poly(A) polymerase Pap1
MEQVYLQRRNKLSRALLKELYKHYISGIEKDKKEPFIKCVKKKHQDIVADLNTSGYLKWTKLINKSNEFNEYTFYITGKGIIEVEFGFPHFVNPLESDISFMINNEDFINNIEQINQLEKSFNSIKENIKLIQDNLEKVIYKVQDLETQTLIRNVISNDPTKLVLCIYDIKTLIDHLDNSKNLENKKKLFHSILKF